MAANSPKVRRSVDGDVEFEMLRRRVHQLRGYQQEIEIEMDQIKDKILAKADELGADVLTIGGEGVVTISVFDRFNVKAREIAERYPRIFKQFGSVTKGIVRVDVR